MQDLDLEKLEDSNYMLDILIQCENVLDMLDIYVYRSWDQGEVIQGPTIRRHWVTFGLRYPHDKMPDPRAALRLLKHGVQVEFNSMKQTEPGNAIQPDQEPTKKTDWLVTITIPRRLLDQTEEADLETYDDDVNPDDVEAAKDIGLDNESSYQADEQTPTSEMPPGQMQPGMGQPPPMQPPAM
jgi:hypothetical protein